MEKPRYISLEEVMFYDTDIGQVVHNLAYLRMIESNRTKLAGIMGMDLKSMLNEGVFPVLLKTEVDYLHTASLGDILRIEGELDRVERARFWCKFSIYLNRNDKKVVTCLQSLAIVKMPDARPKRLPKEWILNWG